MQFFDIDTVFFEVRGYAVSYLEFFGLISGVAAVVLASLNNVWNWAMWVINVSLSFVLFYQVQLYPDMALQVFYFFANVFGWWRWTHPAPGERDARANLKISMTPFPKLLVHLGIGAVAIFLLGLLARDIHEIFPDIFSLPGAYPFADAFITVMSIIATFYLIGKKLESWVILLAVDILATWLYFQRDIWLYGLLYLGFCFVAAFALYNWTSLYRKSRG